MIPGNINTDLISGADEAAYQISRSLRFNSADSAYLSRTPASAGNRKTWTWSGWVKRGVLGSSFQTIIGAGTGGNAEASIRFNSDDTLEFYAWTGSYNARLLTTQVFRDVSAWYHLVAVFDTPNTTADQRIRLYVNGIEITTFSSRTNPTQNYDGYFNNSISHTIGDAVSGASPRFFNGYLADIHFIDGQALTPSSFAETNATTGQWVPKAYTGSYGTNGFKLSFSNNASTTTISQDSSGNNNHWTANNISVTAGAGNDSLVDTPTSYGTDTGAGGEVRGNYATLNPLKKASVGTLSNGNLDFAFTADGSFNAPVVISTIQLPTSGKWYFEMTAGGASGFLGQVGLFSQNFSTRANDGVGQKYVYLESGYVYNVSGELQSGLGTYTSGDIIGVAYDSDTNSLRFYKNGNAVGSAVTPSTSYSYFFGVGVYDKSCSVNFGQRPFAYTAPSGFKALCDTNLPAPTIARPSTVMDVKLYTGNGSTQTISGLGFSPDLVWVKCRVGTRNHVLSDTIRGANNVLASNTTAAQVSPAVNGQISAFNSDGFAVAAGTSDALETNNLNDTYAAWAWDAGSSTVTNTSGSISSQVRANASAGFSVCTFTTQSSGTGTFGHGLNVAPSLVITKARAVANNWITYHASVGNTGALLLNSTAATDTQSFYWNNTTPTSTVVTLGSGFAGSNSLVAYCFAPVAGYSAFGSYTGNGSADGPFVFTGFRPRWVLIKGSSFATTGWAIYDAVRNTFNVANNLLTAESSSAETNYPEIDLLSNGFKLRGTNPTWNYSGQTHIYAAFAENPFQYARAR